jgi:hypothetical protein
MKNIFMFLSTLFISVLGAEEPAKLQATINLTSTRPPLGQPGKIIPTTSIKLSTIIKNIGDETSQAGEIYVRYSFRPPHENEPNSILFETEKVELPLLAGGEEKTIEFQTTHLLPNVFDFVRFDWAMRDYEAVIVINENKQIAGTRALGFTAHYYEGISHEKPVKF